MFYLKKKHSERKEPSHNCSPLRILLTDERMTQQVLDGENTGHLIYWMIRLYQGAASSTDSMIFFFLFHYNCICQLGNNLSTKHIYLIF